MKKGTLWGAFLAVSILVGAMPTFGQSQPTGGSSMGSSSQTMGGSSPSGSSSHDVDIPSGSQSTHLGSSTLGSSGKMEHSSSSSSNSITSAADHGMTQTDKTLNQSLHQALTADPALMSSSRNVHFTTENGTVTMQGTVATEQEKEEIAMKVKQMTGVKEVHNQLQLAPSTSSASGSLGSTTTTR